MDYFISVTRAKALLLLISLMGCRQCFHCKAPHFHNQAENMQGIKNNVIFIREALQMQSSQRDAGS